MLKWKNDFEIGVDLIDSQHKHLFEIGNNAYELLKNDLYLDKYNKIILIIDDLRQYTKYHFKCEEDYMLKTNSPEYIIQKKEHDGFIKKIDNLNLDKIDEDQQKYIEDILSFIFSWILGHIIQKDKLIKKQSI
ncbi:bacteriohemerythrin [Clostridium thailandense]|uniref:bacteriohemerythrin n=1 Tax=Clostridium thailandense TaxID=2794346 RepID=UPI00398A0230